TPRAASSRGEARGFAGAELDRDGLCAGIAGTPGGRHGLLRLSRKRENKTQGGRSDQSEPGKNSGAAAGPRAGDERAEPAGNGERAGADGHRDVRDESADRGRNRGVIAETGGSAWRAGSGRDAGGGAGATARGIEAAAGRRAAEARFVSGVDRTADFDGAAYVSRGRTASRGRGVDCRFEAGLAAGEPRGGCAFAARISGVRGEPFGRRDVQLRRAGCAA